MPEVCTSSAEHPWPIIHAMSQSVLGLLPSHSPESIAEAEPIHGDPLTVRGKSMPCACVFVLILALAASVRLVHLGHASLCHTEAWRARWILEGDVDQARRFPPALFYLGRWLQRTVGRSEVDLRLPYAFAGIICVAAVFAVTRRHFGDGAAAFAALASAVHPVLVYYSRKQLEYSIESMAGMLVLWAGLEAQSRPNARRLWTFLVVSIFACSLSFTSSLVTLACAACITWSVYRSSRSPCAAESDAQVVEFAGCQRNWSCILALLAFVGAAWYLWLAGHSDRHIYVQYYAEVENAWPTDHSPSGLVRWAIEKTFGTLHFVLGMSDVWRPLNWVLGTSFALALAASVGVLWRRNRAFCAIAALLGVELLLVGALRLWPIGDLRHGTFLIPFFCIGIGCGLCRIRSMMRGTLPAMALLTVCLVVPAVRAAKSSWFRPTAWEHSRPVLEYVQEHRRPDDALFVYYFARDAFEYYWPDRSVPALLQPPSDRGNPAVFAARFDEWLELHPRVWFFSSHDWKKERAEWIDHLAAKYEILDSFETQGASVHLVTRDGAAPASP